MNSEDLIALNEEIAGMARAGLPLDQGLAALSKEMGRGRLRQVTAALAADLKAGRTLPQALERQSGRVPPFYAGLVSAGIRTGRIGDVLATLTEYGRSIAILRRIVLDALFYPSIVLLFAFGVFFFQCFFILPHFEDLFQGFNMELPAITRFLFGLGRHPLETIFYPMGLMILALVAVKLTLRWSEEGRRQWARLVYAVPVVGTLIRSARLAAFTDLLAILIDHELPLPEAFALAGAASSDPIMTAMTQQIGEQLANGVPLGDALRNRGLVPEWVSWMTGLGERRGTLGKTLHQIAESYRRQVEMRAALLRSVLPPFLIICTAGTFTAMFVFSVMLPMVRLLEVLR
jgi:type II secretory pathway component PulF